ncbi:hypothetical protein HYFRA_00009557 [Hymenoscyphus fraxineus]|uniref:Uncharacterized protein n=1 Tax=Hymenoscyphus fraxineus TaxID=746836 RepID=A0A9N9KZV0_9HELO|nr:hypothetical protein HYFRA_00009557 [Hymenoscyphus fraxineus]
MATTESAQPTQGRRRPFSNWMKKLANFKNSSSDSSTNNNTSKRNTYHSKSHSKRITQLKKNNPYPESGTVNGHASIPNANGNGNGSFSTNPTGVSMSTPSLNRSRHSVISSRDGNGAPTIGNKSTAHTMSTEPDTVRSIAAPSHAPSSGEATTATIGCGVSSGRGADSTFSSPAPSVRSLTTTLTTIHSAAAPAAPTSNQNTQTVQFSHQFPTSPPPTALPAHLAPVASGGHPATYNTATANNLLTDNASILTLASSSKRRRRRSMDTDASVRALAPSSLFGGSRESLPLSVLSANIDPGTVQPTPHQPRGSVGLNERASIYSATGVAPALPSERNSYYAGKQSILADGGSIKSGLLGHGRNDSVSGNIGAVGIPPGSPLASPREVSAHAVAGRLSRNNSTFEAVDNEKLEETEGEEKNDNGKA